MKILVDTNIILDVLLKREPHNKVAQIIMTRCAAAETVDYIVTRNLADFKQSRVQVIEPDEFVKLL